jgi:hypothetical protein
LLIVLALPGQQSKNNNLPKIGANDQFATYLSFVLLHNGIQNFMSLKLTISNLMLSVFLNGSAPEDGGVAKISLFPIEIYLFYFDTKFVNYHVIVI